MEKDTLKDWERNREEEYFRKRDHELIEQMHRRAEAEAEGRKMAVASGITDEEILSSLQELGYTHETVALVYLAPLVQVAWVDGGISHLKREELLSAARLNGIAEDSPAWHKLGEWIRTRPTDQFFQQNLKALRAILQSMSAERREVTRRELLAGCHTVAGVSDGVLGLGHTTTPAENSVIERITIGLG